MRRDPDLRQAPMFAVPGEFRPIHRPGTPPHGEWMAALPDGTEIIVADGQGKPSPIGIRKAIAIVQGRAYLEARARRLLVPLGKADGGWRLAAIDFGAVARHRDCEFLMRFVFEAGEAGPAAPSPRVEVGFALPLPSGAGSGFRPVFFLTIETMAGLDE